MISAIVCVDKNWGIGYNGDLLVHIPEDMKFFKKKTINNVVIMGRKTYDSLPIKPLPNRINIVVTSKIDGMTNIDEDGTIFVTIDFIKAFLGTLSAYSPLDYYIIGGGQIYNELLPYCNTSYVTKVDYAFEDVDVYFPNLDNKEEWEITKDGKEKSYNGIEYNFCTYKKGMW